MIEYLFNWEAAIAFDSTEKGRFREQKTQTTTPLMTNTTNSAKRVNEQRSSPASVDKYPPNLDEVWIVNFA